MKIRYKLNEDDYLQHQLFVASQSKLIKKRRFRSLLVIPILYIVLSIVFYFYFQHMVLALVFLIAGALWVVFYPLYSKHKHIKFYKKYIQEHYTQLFDREYSAEFKSDHIELKDHQNTSKISLNEIVDIVALKEHYLIRLKSSKSILFPKEVVDDEKLRSIWQKHHLVWLDNTNWRWK